MPGCRFQVYHRMNIKKHACSYIQDILHLLSESLSADNTWLYFYSSNNVIPSQEEDNAVEGNGMQYLRKTDVRFLSSLDDSAAF